MNLSAREWLGKKASTKPEKAQAKALEQLLALRARVLGELHPHVAYWRVTLPPHPDSARERFLQIQADGGALFVEARRLGVTLEKLRIRNTWLVSEPAMTGWSSWRHNLHLWVRPNPARNSTRPWTITGCAAELHNGWSTRLCRGQRVQRRAYIVFRGTTFQCLHYAKELFDRWDVVQRLGGQPAPLVYL